MFGIKRYDLVVIGSGAGLNVIDSALQEGWNCALVERSKFGGTCLTRGCIPSKILVYPADIIREADHAKKIGLDFILEKVRWETVARRMWSQIDESKQIEDSIDNVRSLTTYKGTGEFTGTGKMRVLFKDGSYSDVFKADRFIIAAGGRSYIPDISGLNEAGYLDTEKFFGDGFPKEPWGSLVIIGGGAAGAEFAHVFSAFGTKVTIVEMEPRLVSIEEETISRMLENNFRNHGIDVYKGHKATAVSRRNGKKAVSIKETATGITTDVICDEILVVSGIRPNTDLLRTDLAGIDLDEHGWIRTNEFLETSRENIWALGDINGRYQFRHKANHEADILVRNLFYNEKSKQAVRYDAVPYAIFTHPQVARVGMTEKEARRIHKRVMVGIRYYSSVAKGFAMGYNDGDQDDGFVKLVLDAGMKIIGAHIIGPQAAVLIQSFVYLMNSGYRCQAEPGKRSGLLQQMEKACQAAGTLDPVTQSMVIHPSLSEVTAWIIGNMEWVD